MSKWIRKGDKVVVLAGNEKGRVGTVRARQGERVIIDGINIRKKHVKPKSRMAAGIVQMEMPLHVSNVSLCNEAEKPVKLKVKETGGKKTLVYTDGGKEIVHREVKKTK